MAFYFTTGYEVLTEAAQTFKNTKAILVVPKSDKTFRHVGKFDWSRHEATQPDERSWFLCSFCFMLMLPTDELVPPKYQKLHFMYGLWDDKPMPKYFKSM